MQTKDVRLDPKLNSAIWKRGVQGVPFKMRIRVSRKRNEEGDAKEKLYSFVEIVNVPTTKGLQTVVVEEDDE